MTANIYFPIRNLRNFRIPRHCRVYRAFLKLKHENRKLRDLSMLDPITGLYNARSLVSALEREMYKTHRSGMPTSLIMIDLDHFKQINDTYGHVVGDGVLKKVTETFRRNVRLGDIICRYGGDEFAVILPGMSIPHAITVAKRLKHAIEGTNCPCREKELRITASFGVATYLGEIPIDVTSFVDRADKCLLEAKKGGRNRVVWEAREVPRVEVSHEERDLIKSYPL